MLPAALARCFGQCMPRYLCSLCFAAGSSGEVLRNLDMVPDSPSRPVGRSPIPLSRCLPQVSLALAGLAIAATTQGADADESFYFFSPRYASISPEAQLAAKVDAGLDRFAAEAVGERLAEDLGKFAEQLRESPKNYTGVAGLLADSFAASGWGGREETVRDDGQLRLFRVVVPAGPTIGKEAFIGELRSLTAAYRRIDTVELKIVGIEADSGPDPASARTVVRFDFVGPVSETSSETLQLTGEWLLDWSRTLEGDWLVEHWKVGAMTRGVGANGLFVDVSAPSLGGNASYASQLLPSVDRWRARMDGALGIDVYGHQGVSAGDIDGDGDDDLYVSQPSALPNRLFRNDGELRFSDITSSANVGVLDSTSMALFADIDNDSDQDLIVITALRPLLFRNSGAGSFRHAPDAFDLGSALQGQLTSAALADYDLDGDLDLYVCAYRYHAGTGVRHPPMPYHDANNGPPNYLLRNRGDGTFEDVTRVSGMSINNSRFSFAAAWADYDGDALPDLYVANDFGRNNLFRNNGNGTFADVAAQLGVEDVGAGMSASWFDYDRDGVLDLYVGNMWSAAGMRLSSQQGFQSASAESVRELYRRHAKGNTLFCGQAGGTFLDSTFAAGVEQGRWAWSSGPLDFDNDGFEDIYVANGYVTNTQTQDL